MPEILITGTSGFIGSSLKLYFQEIGFYVFGTTSSREPSANEVKINIQKEEDLAKLPNRKFDAIIHTVALVDQTLPKPRMMDVNAEGTLRICEWAKTHNCPHFIQLSSTAVYGNFAVGENRTEQTHRLKGVFGNPYAQSKAKAERYIERSGLAYTILRLPPVFGPNDSFITPAIVPRILEGRFVFRGKKDHLVSMLYIRNLGPIIEAIIKKGPTNTAYNCTDYKIKWRDFVQEYGRQLGIMVPITIKSPLAVIYNRKDQDELLLMAYSAFGAGFPNDKLADAIGVSNITRFKWQDGVGEAIKAFIGKEPEVIVHRRRETPRRRKRQQDLEALKN